MMGRCAKTPMSDFSNHRQKGKYLRANFVGFLKNGEGYFKGSLSNFRLKK
jgi:hypothetical protein